MAEPALFTSFFLGGFECSTHRLRTGRRLDLLAATAHDRHAAADYRRLRAQGIHTARDGVRWHLIERTPGRYDFSSLLPLVRAARQTGVQVIWDLCHYGWPDDLDIFRPAFVERFARFARAVARLIADETDGVPCYVPINEISFWAWGGAEVAYLNPFATGRGVELKIQLVRAAIAASEAIWSVAPRARLIHADPVLNIIHDPLRPQDRLDAAGCHAAQFQAWDMLAGHLWPQLGGHQRYLDIIGLNYYPTNQWMLPDRRLHRTHHRYRLFRAILAEVWARYHRPLVVAETGAEADERAAWLRYIGGEVQAALASGVPVAGICLYPIVNHPGWDDDRHCHNGLWDYPDPAGDREVCAPLAEELQAQQGRFAAVHPLPLEERPRMPMPAGIDLLADRPARSLAPVEQEVG